MEFSESLLQSFKQDQILNHDQGGLRVVVYGYINSAPALLLLERAPFPIGPNHVTEIIENLKIVKNLGANDIYQWYMAKTDLSQILKDADISSLQFFADISVKLIFPCTDQLKQKYSKQGKRMVIETPSVYRERVLPYISEKIRSGTLDWVENIITGRNEVDDVIYRSPSGQNGNEGLILLPDLNWDRSTKESLHLLGLPERRDFWSIRDLKKKHVCWLRTMRKSFLEATVKAFDWVEVDQLKIYVHYQPTYYHFHVHIVHVASEVGNTQAVGKAIGLESIIESLELMDGDQEHGIEQMTLHYTVGEASELWTEVFEPLKRSGTD
ncbi:m7GpppX diphosphatase [Golovinomyces cichoracearum]|uniref:M7GpppX diphosphatase n=1 Tax=Golovinomyces cichoracearum TaxID=62708 RepID=A0A420IKV7_9PEZI|nr:m7GpppX diphosphatase [Golovinomyces cichoracearum]